MASRVISIPLIGPSGQARFSAQNSRKLRNCYVESDDSGGKGKVVAIGRPGTKLWTAIAAVARGWVVAGSYLYFVSGDKLYRVSTAGSVSAALGTLTTNSGNPVSMRRNRTQVLIADGTQEMFLYDFSTSTFSTVGSFSTAVPINDLSRSGTTVTCTTADNHEAFTGQSVKIEGADYAPDTTDYYNGTFTLTKTGATTFTYTITGKQISAATAQDDSPWRGVITTTTPHHLVDGDVCSITGMTPTDYNKTSATVIKLTEYQFKYTLTSDSDPGTATVLGKILPPDPDTAANGVPIAYIRESTLTFTADHVESMDGYFLAQNSRESAADGVHPDQFYISEPDDGTTWDATKVGAAQRHADDLETIWGNGGDLFLMGTFSCEPYYDSGASDFPFEPSKAAATPWGCAAPWSVANLGEGIAWVAQRENGQVCVVLMEGYQPKEISSRAVSYRLSLADPDDLAAAEAYSFRRDGHDFYVLSWPSETWMFDAVESRKLGTLVWTELTSSTTRHLGQYSAYFAGKHLISSRTDAEILEIDPYTYTDRIGATNVKIEKQIVGGYINAEDIPFNVSRVHLDMDHSGGIGEILLETSEDNGDTWVSRGLQQYGDGDKRVEWFGLGTFETDLLLRFTTSDSVPFCVIGCYMTIEARNES